MNNFFTVRPKMVESTSLGAALAAGFAVGVWNMQNVKSDFDTFKPTSSHEGEYFNYVLNSIH